MFDGVNFRGLSTGVAGQPIVSWINNDGNAIVNAIGFDPPTATVTVLNGNNRDITPPSYATTVILEVDAPVLTASVNFMAAPPAGAPIERTLVLGDRVTVREVGMSNLDMGANLTGPSHAIAFRWFEAGQMWREMARS